MLIGIVGTLGAGKGTVVDYLKQKGFAHYSASGYLKELMIARNIPIDRDAYSRVSGEIRYLDPAGIVRVLYERMVTDGVQDAIIESIHDAGEAAFIKAMGGILLGVDADMLVRYDRIIIRGSEKDHVTFEEFTAQITREEAGGGHHNIRSVLGTADYLIENNGTLEELHAKVDDFLATGLPE
jgi:dephospho-CoA kinase